MCLRNIWMIPWPNMVGRLRKFLSLWFRTITTTIRLTRQNESNKTINIGRSKILGDIITPLSYADNQTFFLTQWMLKCERKKIILFSILFFSFMWWRDPTRVFFLLLYTKLTDLWLTWTYCGFARKTLFFSMWFWGLKFSIENFIIHEKCYHNLFQHLWRNTWSRKDLRRYPGFDPITFNFSENSNMSGKVYL